MEVAERAVGEAVEAPGVEQVAAERTRYGNTTLPQPFRRPLPEARVIEVVPVRKAYAGKESHPIIVESVK